MLPMRATLLAGRVLCCQPEPAAPSHASLVRDAVGVEDGAGAPRVAVAPR